MSIAWRLVRVAAIAGATAFATASTAQAQGNPCDSSDTRQKCSQECCGSRSCPPSCAADCVSACIKACRDPGQRDAYGRTKQQMQIRCGNKSVR
jgi:hypothetical protein